RDRPILEHRAHAGGTFHRLRHTGADALSGWPVRCHVFRGDPAHARARYSIGAGATRLSTIWLVLLDALVMIAGGTAIALPCVWALGRLVESQLFGVKPTDPFAVAAATLLLASATLAA